MHMMLEPLLLFEAVLIENRPVHQLIDSDFSYRSGPLSGWYKTGKRTGGLPPTRLAYKREALGSRREGGVITNAAVMTMTSSPVRSQPITRGAWMLTVIFNNPPEPPPADVPPLPEQENGRNNESLTIRERLASHRDRPDCVGCHVKIDPLGFALETTMLSALGGRRMAMVEKWTHPANCFAGMNSLRLSNLRMRYWLRSLVL